MADKNAGRKSPAKKRPSVEKSPERPADAEKHDEHAPAPAPQPTGRDASGKGQPLARSASNARPSASTARCSSIRVSSPFSATCTPASSTRRRKKTLPSLSS